MLASGPSAFTRSLPFSELDALVSLMPYIKASMKFQDLSIISVEDAQAHLAAEGESSTWSKERMELSEPGSPSNQFWNA